MLLKIQEDDRNDVPGCSIRWNVWCRYLRWTGFSWFLKESFPTKEAAEKYVANLRTKRDKAEFYRV